MKPFLVFRSSGRTIAAVVGYGFGGGTLLLGVGTALADTFQAGAIWPAFRGYFLAALPFFVAGVVLAMCRRELWFVPEAQAFRMLTFRPWLLSGPRVEQASVDEYRGLCTEPLAPRAERSSVLVSLVTGGGETVPVREFDERDEAKAFVDQLAEVTGLPLGPKPELPDATER